MYFAILPKRAVLADINAELIHCYTQIKRDAIAVSAALNRYSRRHSEEFYYDVRARNPSSPIERAARFLYLNRACFNGIYRVNRKGEFNVPKGDKETIIFPYDDFQAVAKYLRPARLIWADFEVVIDEAEEGDICFCDPPYTVTHNKNCFVRYNENLFSWTDQIRLRNALERAHKRGVQVLCTNADHEAIKELYSLPAFQMHSVSRASVIGGTKAVRGRYSELLISNYSLPL
jgi:DNA adenine methylase